jgi:hypothetical protein
MKSAWTNGLFHGSIFGGVMLIVPLVGAAFGKLSLEELALAGGVTISIWGSFGFAAGFFGYREPRTNALRDRDIGCPISPIRKWGNRIVSGLLLSVIPFAVVGGIEVGLFFFWQGDPTETPKTKATTDELRRVFVVACGMIASWVGAVSGCWLGALLAPGDEELASLARGAFLASLLSAFAGGCMGAAIGLIQMQQLFQSVPAILSLIAGGLSGVAGAFLMRIYLLKKHADLSS